MLSKLSLKEKLYRNLGPMRLLALSFAVVIFIGTILLCLPLSNQESSLSVLDNLFIATSATCVTGLLPTVCMNQFTVFGQIVILLMIQVGGLGLMSVLALFIVMMKHKLAHNEKKMMQDALNKVDLKDMPKFLKDIFIYTFIFEGLGALFIFSKFINIYDLPNALFKSLFLSISAFCNAGIDNITDSSLIPFQTDAVINIVVACLIILGGLGFTVWFDLKDHLVDIFKHKTPFKVAFSKLMVHTKIVLYITFYLIVSGMFFILLFEWNNPNSLGNMSITNKIMAAFFNSVTLRTAGFATFNYGLLNRSTLIIMCIYMLIGGSPGGTAGGIKTTTFFMIFFLIYNEVKANSHMNIFKREIALSTFSKAFTVLMFYCVLVFGSIVILSYTENLDLLAIIFEIFSAIGTVGLSMGITASLSTVGKLVIIILMFIGRVGPMTIALSVVGKSKNRKSSAVEYPAAEVLIG